MEPYFDIYNSYFDLLFPVLNMENRNRLNADIMDLGNTYLLRIDVPGAKKEDVKMSLENHILNVSVSFRKEKNANIQYLANERNSGTYTRSFKLGDGINKQDISASVEDGVLSITINKNDGRDKKGQSKD